NKRDRDALAIVDNVIAALDQCQSMLDKMRDSTFRRDDILNTLTCVDDVVSKQRGRLSPLTREIVADQVRIAVTKIETVEACLQAYADIYPTNMPLRIDNAHLRTEHFTDTPAPTLIAYCLALTSRIFHHTSRSGASLILVLAKLYGSSLVALAGGPNILQMQALNATPEDVRTVEKRLNLGIRTTPYAVCPTCRRTYEPAYTPPSSLPRYPRVCREETDTGICGKALVDETGKAIEVFEYYPFFDWFGRLVALPGFEAYADRFCDRVDMNAEVPHVQRGIEDGTLVRSFPAPDGRHRAFIQERRDEKRWLFALHMDFFNAEGNTLRGRKASTGQIVIVCLNLPLDIRNDDAYKYLSIIQGPDEPSAKDAAYRHYLRPLITDLEIGFSRGIRFSCVSSPDLHHASADLAYRHVHRMVIAALIADLKAARPCAGLMDVMSHSFCSVCCCWLQVFWGRVDFENWEKVDDDLLRKGALAWRDASPGERLAVELQFAVRFSELWKLPYWKPSQQVVVDPMHTWFLIILQRFFREAMRLDSTFDKAWSDRRPAFHYDFKPPPPLSSLSRDKPVRGSGSAAQGGLTYNAAVDMGKIHKRLTAPMDGTDGDRKDLQEYLHKLQKAALVEVCKDVHRVSKMSEEQRNAKEKELAGLSRAGLAEVLVAWRMTMPLPAMEWARIDRDPTIAAVRQTISEVSVPTWLKDKPPSDICSKDAGTMKASEWRWLYRIFLPLALLAKWHPDSPYSVPRAATMQPILALNMNLTIATIILLKPDVTEAGRRGFREQLRSHILGLRAHFPGFMFPGYHMAFHITDFMALLGPARNWWCFPFERLAGRLQRIPKSHKEGESEHTMLHSFLKGSIFRQWLLLPTSPPILKYCRSLLDKAHRYLVPESSEKADDASDDDDDGGIDSDSEIDFAWPDDHANPSRHRNIDPSLNRLAPGAISSCSHAEAPRGFYRTTGSNSYVCIRSTSGRRWAAARIRHIVKYESGRLGFIVQRARLRMDRRVDFFSQYWEDGFEAQWVSAEFEQKLELLTSDQVLSHAARWRLGDGTAVVLSLHQVRL
ncbi:hypothetical protein EV715DRAFT_215257, partial [Schizophyllum commune]